MNTVRLGILLQLFAGLLSGTLNAQSTWTWLSPLPQGNVMIALQALDTNIVVAVGNASTVLRSTDGGNHWNVRHRVGGTADYLADIAFSDSRTGIAVGENGKILLTTDAGETWSTQSSGTAAFLSALGYAGLQTWVAASYDGSFLRSGDGGATWHSVIPAGSLSFNALQFIPQGTGFAVGPSGTILKSTDRGLTWEDKSVATSYALRGAHFFTPDTGFVWGDMGVFFQTTDGGQTWSSRSDVPAFWKVIFINRVVGYATGAILSGSLYKTTDGGVHWMLSFSGNVGAVSFAGLNDGFCVGGDGTIVTTHDGGSTWQYCSTSVECNFFRDITFIDATTGIIVGWGGKIYRTTNGGTEWDPRWGSDNTTFYGVTLRDSIGIVVGEAGRILRSTDQGQTWTAQNSGTTLDLKGVSLHDSVAIAVGDSGRILRSTNLGLTWTSISAGPWGLRTVGFFTSDTIIVAGEIILRSTDGGVNWISGYQYAVTRLAIYGRTAIATGPRGVVYLTTDCGTGWVLRSVGVDDDLYGIALGTDQMGLVTTGSGRVFSTSNGGATWHDECSPTTNWLFGACFVKPDTALVVGWGSTILQLDLPSTTGIVNPPGLSPQQFILNQNFPNPFNPTTRIQYQLSSAVHVQLSVFDLLGRDVKVLVNEQQDKGVHSAIFDGTGLPSGIYFYRMQAGSFTVTKKLVLLK